MIFFDIFLITRGAPPPQDPPLSRSAPQITPHNTAITPQIAAKTAVPQEKERPKSVPNHKVLKLMRIGENVALYTKCERF